MIIQQDVKIGDNTFAIEGGSLAMQGTDVLNDALLTVGGGTLRVTGASVLPESLVAHWKLDETEGTTAFDTAGAGPYDGTVTDATWFNDDTPGGRGQVLNFDGDLDQMDIPSMVDQADQGDFTSELSYAMWINLNSAATGIHVVLNTAQAPWKTGDIHFQFANTDTVRAGVNGADNLDQNTAPPVGEWHHLVYTYKDGDQAVFYLDGVEDGSVDYTGTSRPVSMRERIMGGWSNSRWLDAMLDDVMIYNRALTLEEAEQVYQASLTHTYEASETDASGTSLLITDDTTIVSEAPVVYLGDVTVAEGKSVTFEGVLDLTLQNLGGGNNTTIDFGASSSLTIRGTVMPDLAPGVMTVKAENVFFQPGSVYAATIGATANDRLDVQGDVDIDDEDGGTLHFQIDGHDPFTEGTYTLLTAGGVAGITGEFRLDDSLGDYLTAVTVDNVAKTMTVTVAHDLHPGDADLNLTTDVRDFNVWNTNKFTSGTDWASGDFDGNGVTDVRDFNVWNTSKFTSVTTPGAPAADGQVPEPGTLVLLALGALGLLAMRRRR